MILRDQRLNTDKGEVGGSSPPGPLNTGCCPKNLNPQSNSHLTASSAYPLLAPSDIPPAPPVGHRRRPACRDRASSESSRGAGGAERCSVRLSPCSPASW